MSAVTPVRAVSEWDSVDCGITSHILPGKQIHVLRAGPRASTGLVMIHGYGDGAYVWRNFMRSFPASQSLVAVDLAGHGSSYHRASGHYSTADAVEDLVAVLDELRLERFALIGHSWGGSIALHLAAALPRRVLRLVVVDTGPEENAEAVEHVRRDLRLSHRTYGSVGEYADWLAERRPLADPGILEEIAREATRKRPDGLLELRLDAALARPSSVRRDDLWPVLGKVEAEVLLLRGQMSGVLPAAMALKMSQALKRCRLRTIPRAGHSVMVDNPSGFASAVIPFLRDPLCRDPGKLHNEVRRIDR